jgi:imidazoleglycerol-phosphate dehydratase
MTIERSAEVRRTTGETDVRVSLTLEGAGAGSRETGLGFFDHMLDSLARHGALDLEVDASGDLETGGHHTVEDVGLALGQALDEALGDRSGIVRFGEATIPMDEALATAVVDVSGRPYLAFAGELPATSVSGFDTDLLPEFMRAVASTARLTLHVRIEAGGNAHHVVEACFKAFARALRAAVEIDPGEAGVPSTKGLL